MRIKEATVFGFGKWTDMTFHFPETGLFCLYGENEAGKSTLQQFILYVMFGLPPRKRKLFYPKRSSHFGGSITVKDERIGTFTIERTENECRCLLDNGEEREEVWLKEYLKGMNREIYEAIYAFSLHDLLEIRTMKEAELSDILFSVGLTGASQIYDVEKKLSQKIGELFKKTGTRPVINEQLQSVKQLHDEMERYRKEEATYVDMRKKEALLERELYETEQHLFTLKQTLTEKEQTLQLLPLINEYERCLQLLQTYPETIPFPEEGLERYERIKDALIPLRSEFNVFHEQKQQYEREIVELENNNYRMPIYERAKSLLERKQEAHAVKEELEKLTHEREFVQEEIASCARDIGIERTEIERSTFAYHLEHRWEEIYTDNRELHVESEKLTEEFEELREKRARLDDEKATLEALLLEEKEAEQMQQDVFSYEMAHSFLQHSAEETERIEQLVKKQKRQSNTYLLGTVVLAVISIAAGFFFEQAIAYVAAVIFLAFGIVLSHSAQRSLKELANTKRTDATPPISAEQYRLYSEQLKQHDEAKTKLEHVLSEQNEIERKIEEWKRKSSLFEQKEMDWIKRVEVDRKEYPFLQEIEPLYWRKLLDEIRNMLTLIDKEATILANITMLREKEQTFSHLLTDLANEVGLEAETMTFQEVEKIVQTSEATESKLTQLRDELDKRNRALHSLAEKINSYEKVRDELFNLAQVEDEETFYTMARKKREKEELEQKRDVLYNQLRNNFNEHQLETLLNMDFEEVTLQTDVASLKEEIKRSEALVTNINRELAALEVELKRLETSEKRSLLTMKHQLAVDNLEKLANKWATYQLAYTTLQRAKASYQEKYLNEVIEKTNHYFKHFTNGAYTNVFPPTEKQLFQVEASDNIRYTVEELSQGTIDQLYISLRLAITQVMNDRFQFPLMMDDAILHFDQKRRKQFIRFIEELAEKEQIILFTCNELIRDEFSQAHVKTIEQGMISYR